MRYLHLRLYTILQRTINYLSSIQERHLLENSHLFREKLLKFSVDSGFRLL